MTIDLREETNKEIKRVTNAPFVIKLQELPLLEEDSRKERTVRRRARDASLFIKKKRSPSRRSG